MSVLEIRDLVVDYRQKGRSPVRAVAGASLTIESGQIVGLVGESGCGKSTLARAVVGLTPAVSGSIRFEDKLVSHLTRRARPAELTRLQMVFQNPYQSLNPRRKVGSQVADGLLLQEGLTRKERRSRAIAALEQVGLPVSAAHRFPHQFSGGQRQRIAIARALAASPSVIVLDEPLSSLDSSAQAQLANLLTELSVEHNLGLLLISHDLAIVRHVATVTYVMYLGRVVEAGPTRQVWSEPLHPYTEALIGSIPRPDGRGELPKALPGEVPDPGKPPPGCVFHPRCSHAFDRCTEELPSLIEVRSGRRAACWLREVDGTQPGGDSRLESDNGRPRAETPGLEAAGL